MYVVHKFAYSFNTVRPTVISMHSSREEAQAVADANNKRLEGVRRAPHYKVGFKK